VRRLLKSSALWAGLALLLVIGVIYAVYSKYFAPSTGAAVLKKLGLTGGPDTTGASGSGGSSRADQRTDPSDASSGDIIVSLKGLKTQVEDRLVEWGVMS
jgi:hypothetical protein